MDHCGSILIAFNACLMFFVILVQLDNKLWDGYSTVFCDITSVLEKIHYDSGLVAFYMCKFDIKMDSSSHVF